MIAPGTDGATRRAPDRPATGGVAGSPDAASTVLALDSSALLATQADGPARAVVLDALATGGPLTACAVALAEALVAVDRLSDEPVLRADLEDGLRRLWDHLYVVPVDAQLLDAAAALSRTQPLRLPHALHLAAAAALPGPVRFVTFDPAQIPVALALGFDVVSL